jgi:hypothetical protein
MLVACVKMIVCKLRIVVRSKGILPSDESVNCSNPFSFVRGRMGQRGERRISPFSKTTIKPVELNTSDLKEIKLILINLPVV